MLTDKQYRIGLIISLAIATLFVMLSAFTDLNNPGSSIAIEYYNIALVFLVLTVIFSLPLWYKKIKAIEAWELQMKNEDPHLIRVAIWRAIRPIVTSLVIALILSVVFVVLINYFDLIPAEMIENYKEYYAPKPLNISNFNLSEYPNTSIVETP